MMFIGQVSLKRLGAVAGVCILGGVLIFGTLKVIPEESFQDSFLDRFSTWKARIDRFTEPKDIRADEAYKITDENYQESHAKIAIANGHIPGLPGSGVERDFLPQAYSDFIFAIIVEEMGLPGGLIVILLYVALMVRAGVLASKCEKTFPRYLILGCAMMITTQALFNMCVAVGILPVTGQTLPLISRGGTSTIVSCAYFGIILACSAAKSEDDEYETVEDGVVNVDYT